MHEFGSIDDLNDGCYGNKYSMDAQRVSTRFAFVEASSRDQLNSECEPSATRVHCGALSIEDEHYNVEIELKRLRIAGQ
jgi:hypothetical protein